ncbi:hypothetical protein GMLC_33930 [Geomonas limicola]|uniref:Response regulatory domain-containing protein n=1 Tax=Geomonas limicola TaxID=2740186 RepID=A0A6V8NDC5_9BACT|nr:response regulator transcription factor [Geomonas limicola]GFO69814.1 hypothetical protein GMLC_33930 [Geomonas limicola]
MEIRILIVDDHAMIRKVLRRHLQDQEGFHVVGEAGNGVEGIDLVRLLQPDLVLMDVAMPEMDGIEATRRIRSEFPHVKVLILSVYNTSDHLHRAVRAGAGGYVLKELAAEEVGLAIRTIMGGCQFFGAELIDHLAPSPGG